MNYITRYYKNKCEQLQEQILILERDLYSKEKNKNIEEGFVSDVKNTFTDPVSAAMLGGLILTDIATKKYQPTYPTPTTFTGHLTQEFGTFPTTTGVIKGTQESAKAIGRAVVSPVETIKQTAKAIKNATPSSVPSVSGSLAGAKNLGKFATAVALPLVAGHAAHAVTDTALETLGLESSEPFVEMPATRNVVSSAADWAAMQSTGQALSNYFAGRALGTGVAYAAGSGALAGAAVPFVAYGGYKTGEAMRDIPVGGEATLGSSVDDLMNYLAGGEQLEPKLDLEKIYGKASKMKEEKPLKSKTEQEIEQSTQKPFELAPY